MKQTFEYLDAQIEGVEMMVEKAVQGDTDPKEAAISIEYLSKRLKDMKDDLKPVFLDYLEKDGQKEIIHHNCIIKKVPGRKMHSFDHYDGYVLQKSNLKKLEANMKTAETGVSVVIDDELIPPAKVSFTKESYSIKIT